MDDLISRKEAIDLLKQMRKDGDMVPWEGKDVFARIRKLPSAQPVDEGYLIDWYISSVDNSEPVWTEAHIEELMNDFYLIPKECIDG